MWPPGHAKGILCILQSFSDGISRSDNLCSKKNAPSNSKTAYHLKVRLLVASEKKTHINLWGRKVMHSCRFYQAEAATRFSCH